MLAHCGWSAYGCDLKCWGSELCHLTMTEGAFWPSAVLGSGRQVQVMAAVDSEALFKAKCKQLKLPDEAVTRMSAKGWTTYGTFAFAVPGDPGKISDSDFRSIVCQPVLGSEQEHVPKLRRLHFEAFAITAAELKRTAEVQESDQPRKLPVVELAARYEILQQRVKPLRLMDKLEPSQALVNQAAHMLEEQRIKYVEWFRCTSRAQEVNAVKEDSSMKLLQSSKEGAVLLRDPESGLKASTGSDLEVMQALRRRGVAYDLAAIMSFEAHEKLIDTLFAEYQRDVMPGHHPVSFAQMQMVDREIHVRMAEMTRSGLTPTASGGMPLDDVIVQVLALPAIQWMLMPRPKAQSAGAVNVPGLPSQPAPKPKPKPKAKAKAKARGTSAGDEDSKPPAKKKRKVFYRMPKGLFGGVAKDNDGKALCFDYNLGHCSGGDSCAKGLHRCCYPDCFASDHTFLNHPA